MDEYANQINTLAEGVIGAFRWEYELFRDIVRSLVSKAQAVVTVAGISLGALLGLLSQEGVRQKGYLLVLVVVDLVAFACAVFLAISSMLEGGVRTGLPTPESAVARLRQIAEAGKANFHPLRIAGFHGDSFQRWADALADLRKLVAGRQTRVLWAQGVLLMALIMLATLLVTAFGPRL